MDYVVWSLICAVVVVCIFAVVFPYYIKMFLCPRPQVSAQEVGTLVFVKISNIGLSTLHVYGIKVADIDGRYLSCVLYKILQEKGSVVREDGIYVSPDASIVVVFRCSSSAGAYVILSTSDGTYKVSIQHVVT